MAITHDDNYVVDEISDDQGFELLFESEISRIGRHFVLEVHANKLMTPADVSRILGMYAELLETRYVTVNQGPDQKPGG